MAEMILKYITVLVWPVTVIILVLIFRKALVSLITSWPKSKIKISLFGVEVETTLPELESMMLETVGGHLEDSQLDLLKRLKNEGPIYYEPKGVPSDQRKWVRPIRNAGLIKTHPLGVYLSEA